MAKIPRKKLQGSSYYIEYLQRGNSIKVTAIDPVTGIEASIVGSSKVTQAELNRVAVRKLKYVIEKHAKGEFGKK
ncbi:MAG: hypothetical protein KAR62_06600 [Sphingomonadales bacterium]|nr:hypothetical protein [Sphingomonadales bacterium]